MRNFFVVFVLTAGIPVLIVAELNTNAEDCGRLRPEQLYNLKTTVESNEFPWMATVYYSDESLNKFPSQSILISNRYLVFAPLFELEIVPMTVKFGSASACRNGTSTCHHIVETAVFHPDRIALIRLKEHITITDYMRPICLPSLTDIPRDYVAQQLPLTGLLKHSGTYSKKYVHVVDAEMCGSINERTEKKYICANTCENGSKFLIGSALMDVKVQRLIADHYILVGILIFGRPFCSDSSPDQFIRLDYMVEWIKDEIMK